MRRKKLLQAVEEGTAAALVQSQAALAEAVERLSPYVERAQDYVTPLVEEANLRIRPLAQDAEAKLKPVVQRGVKKAAETLDRVQPAIEDALVRASGAADATVKRVQPGVEDALSRITPLVENARNTVQDDLLPKLSDTIDHFAGHAHESVVIEAETGKPKKSWGKRLVLLALLGAALGGIVTLVKKAIEPPVEADWVSHTPSDAFIAHPSHEITEDFAPPAESMDAPDEVIVAPAGDAEVTLEDAEDLPVAIGTELGEGSYVGEEPPEGFEIKGNSRSKKFHRPGQARYSVTNADVWFSSPEAAETAGYEAAKS